ncbi:uncharacterized protein LOC135467514 [Liolophura sinensis]|uniref:uncharacterized protein LOC135467514 n=1 Tax=Liolophura sinensis TaxID=3198878 RepID=UPI00315964D2
MRMELQAEADTRIMSHEEEIGKLKEEITALREKSSIPSTSQAQLEELAQMKMKVFGLESDLKMLPKQYEKRIASLTETVDQKNNHITFLKQEMRRLNEQVSANDTICFLKENERKPSATSSVSHSVEDSAASDTSVPEVLYAGRSGIVDSDSIYILQSQNNRLQKENKRLLAKLEAYEKHTKRKGLRSQSKLGMKENTIPVTQEKPEPVCEGWLFSFCIILVC